MVAATATATEVKNNFGHYLGIILNGDEVIITKKGKEVGRLIPRSGAVSYLTDSLTGILKGNDDYKQAKEENLRARYEIVD